jgi:hypothetical protein
MKAYCLEDREGQRRAVVFQIEHSQDHLGFPMDAVRILTAIIKYITLYKHLVYYLEKRKSTL